MRGSPRGPAQPRQSPCAGPRRPAGNSCGSSRPPLPRASSAVDGRIAAYTDGPELRTCQRRVQVLRQSRCAICDWEPGTLSTGIAEHEPRCTDCATTHPVRRDSTTQRSLVCMRQRGITVGRIMKKVALLALFALLLPASLQAQRRFDDNSWTFAPYLGAYKDAYDLEADGSDLGWMVGFK